jgi:glycosyltransferase involved in cell wall biosynthesis
MIGRGDDPIKRFELGINAMSHIINEIPDYEMKIISKLENNNNLKNLVEKLNINKNVKFVGYFSDPSIYFKNASLHLFPTLAEAFPNILSETLIYGIPNILAGLDYVSTAKGGTVIIYDDSPISIAKIAIKILKNKRYRKKLGKEARNNMKKFKNDLLLKKWIKLILSVYKGESFYEKLRNSNCKLSEEESLKIINNQIKLLKLRNKKFQNITINDIENLTFIENIGFKLNLLSIS